MSTSKDELTEQAIIVLVKLSVVYAAHESEILSMVTKLAIFQAGKR